MRQNFSLGQEIIAEDMNSIQSRLERGVYDRIIYELISRKSNGFFQDGFSVVRTSSIAVDVKAGLGFLEEDTGTKDPFRKPVVLDADDSISIDTPDATNPRIDIICVKSDRVNSETENRKFKDEFVDTISTQNFVISTDWSADINYVVGVAAASPSAPAVPAGYVKIAELAVAANTGIPASGGVTDFRALLPIATSTSITGTPDYDAIVGDAATDQGVTHSTLQAALSDAQAGWKILVLQDQTINTTPVVADNNVEIVFKRGVSMIKGAANDGLQIDGNDCKVTNARFSSFNVGGDNGVVVSGGALRTYLDAPRFNDCDTNIDDSGTQTYVNVEYTE